MERRQQFWYPTGTFRLKSKQLAEISCQLDRHARNFEKLEKFLSAENYSSKLILYLQLIKWESSMYKKFLFLWSGFPKWDDFCRVKCNHSCHADERKPSSRTAHICENLCLNFIVLSKIKQVRVKQNPPEQPSLLMSTKAPIKVDLKHKCVISTAK